MSAEGRAGSDPLGRERVGLPLLLRRSGSFGMRRAVGLLVTVSLSVAACGKSSPPKAFPGTATDKARELVRREAALGVRVGTVDSTARAYGTGGDGFCAEGRP